MKKLMLVAAVLVGSVAMSHAGVNLRFGLPFLPLPPLPHIVVAPPIFAPEPYPAQVVVAPPFCPPGVIVEPCPPPVRYGYGYYYRYGNRDYRGYDRGYGHGRGHGYRR